MAEQQVKMSGPLARAVGFGTKRRGALALGPLWCIVLTAPLFAMANNSADVVVPLAQDFGVLSRLLITMPLLVMTAPLFDSLVDEATAYPARIGLLPPEAQSRMDRLAGHLRRLRANPVIEAVLASAAVAGAIIQPALPGPLIGLEGWGFNQMGELNAAGAYYALGGLAVFRFLILLWFWRLLLWTIYLARLALLKPALNPAHPDGVGGLAYLGFVQQWLSVALLAGGFMLAGSVANRLTFLGESLEAALPLLFAYAILYPLLLVAPLLLTMPTLIRTKRLGIFDYGAIGQAAAQAFCNEWIEGKAPDGNSLISSPHPSAMADFTAMHGVVQKMSYLPITTTSLAFMIVSAAAPLLLLVLLQVPLEVLLQSALGEIPPFSFVSNGTGGG